ncbi:MAG: hypothetical protein GX794_02360 [Acholeplasmataceae bacterium]|nr:hypothetical protein [Acholeplasmataceae bacterium]
MKKIYLIISILLLSFSLIACNGENKNNLKLAENANISIDGFIDEDAYDLIPYRLAGVKGQVKVQYAADKAGIYFGLTVTDKKHEVAKTGLVNSDYVGIAIDAFAVRGENNLVEETTHLFRVDVEKNYVYSVGDGYGSWDDLLTGKGDTITDDGLEIHIEVIKDDSYIVEMFLSWERLGTNSADVETRNNVMYYIEHRDFGVDVKADANIQAPSNYNSLRLLGDRKGSNMPLEKPEITIDGLMNEAAWDNATITNQGNFKNLFGDNVDAGDFVVKAFFGKDGLYIGVLVDDYDLNAPKGPGEAYKNDGMELRIHVFDGNNLPILSYKWLLDLHGFQWHETGSGGISSSFAPHVEMKYFIDGTVNNSSDTDRGWGLEMFIPYSHLGMESANSYIKILSAVGTFEQNNALPGDYAAINDTNWDVVEDYPTLRRK